LVAKSNENLFTSFVAMTVIELEKDFFKQGAPSPKITVACVRNDFGYWGVGVLEDALCFVIGLKQADLSEVMRYTQKRWGVACEAMAESMKADYSRLLEDAILGRTTMLPKLALIGTPFQRAVWRSLLAIPRGETRTYGDIAKELGCDNGARAVGGAVGANSIAVIVPCHRVLGVTGIGGYAWGVPLKQQLLAAEASCSRIV